jgi:hypothetical protein
MLIQRLWDAAKDVNGVLWPARFSIGVTIISVPFLLFIGPAQDALLAAIGQHHSLTSKLALAGICFLWAIETFYWAYFMSRLPAPRRGVRAHASALLKPRRLKALNEHFPFCLGLSTLFIAAGAAVKANWGNATSLWLIGLAFVVDVAIYIACTLRFGPLKVTALIYVLLQIPWTKEPQSLRTLRKAAGVHIRRDLFPLPQVALPARPRPRVFTQQSRTSRFLLSCLTVLTVAVYLVFSNAPMATRQLVAVVISLLWLVVGSYAVIALPTTDMLRLTRGWVIANFTLFTGIFILSLYAAPVLNGGSPNLVTAPLVMFSAFCAWVFFGTFFFVLPAELFRLPVTTMILGLALLLSIFPGDNHDVRHLAAKPGDGAPLADAFAQWYGQWDAAALETWGNRPPLVIVATAGGASRAGYWAAKVLGELEAAYPGFHHHVFAISSVSGGTVGAGLWRAMLQNERCQRQGPDEAGMGGTYVNCARLFFCQDFLGPLFLDGLYADFTQRILPGRLLPDRAVALEQSWEHAWSNMMRDPKASRPATAPNNSMSSPFHELVGDAKDWRPLLLINGTSEKTGRRIITSQLAIDRDKFPDALDFFAETHTELNLSTALHNSARFTYLDAAGNIVVEPVKPGDAEIRPDRILDGGYFENFGAATAFDLLHALNALNSPNKFRPVIVQISSDPTLETDGAREAEWKLPLDQWPPDLSLTMAADAQAPLVTLYNTRDAEGIRATKLLRKSVGDDNYAHFRLTNQDIPMSWAMSGEVLQFIDQEWTPDPPKLNEAPNPNLLAKDTIAKIFGTMPANTVSVTPNPPCGGL